MTRQVFICGEMLDPVVKDCVLGSTIESTPFELEGYGLHNEFKQKSFLEEKQFCSVQGELVLLNEKQLWSLDQWKEIPALRRSSILLNQKECEIYVRNEDFLDVIQEESITNSLEFFRHCRDLTKTGMCDLHLLFPCSLDNNTIASKLRRDDNICSLKSANSLRNVDETEVSKLSEFFLQKLLENNRAELQGDFVKDISRESLGVFEIGFEYDGKAFCEYCFGYISRHHAASIGMLSFVITTTMIPVELDLCALCQDSLFIIRDHKRIPLVQWMKQNNLIIEGNAKAVVFAYNDLEKQEVANCLACEMEPMEKLTGIIAHEWAYDNFAQYEVAEVYASDRCLLEISHFPEMSIISRLNTQAIELFFVELLMLQEAAISHISTKVYAYLNHDFNKEKKKKTVHADLFELSREAANAIQFVDYKRLRFPTVKISAQKIAKRFGADEEFDKYNKCREVLEQMIEIDTYESEKIEGSLMNMLLLFLTMIQVAPTLVSLTYSLLMGEYTMTHYHSGLLGTAGCLLLYVIYRIAYGRAVKKSKRRRIGKIVI